MNNYHRKLNYTNGCFDMNNATSTIKRIIEKCYKKNSKYKYNNINKTEIFLQSLDKIRLKEEVKENDYMYIIKEMRKQAKLDQMMIDLYGTKAKQQNLPKFTLREKTEKSLFFNPTIQSQRYISNDNYSINSNDTNNNFLKCRGNRIKDQIIKLPSILNEKESEFDENYSKKNIRKLNNSSLDLSRNNFKSQRYHTNYKLLYDPPKKGEKGYYSQYSKKFCSYDKKNSNLYDKNMYKTVPAKKQNSLVFVKKGFYNKDRDEEFKSKLYEVKTSIVKNKDIQKKYLKMKDSIFDNVKIRYNYINNKFFQ